MGGGSGGGGSSGGGGGGGGATSTRRSSVKSRVVLPRYWVKGKRAKIRKVSTTAEATTAGSFRVLLGDSAGSASLGFLLIRRWVAP
ncbi:MAG: hypothetical protein EA353_14765 [Puniceicoccaceae bacterium]|nr:MAG: hypothetical protein EA353_14765 [Puniceicoccaceae bacterium]